MKKKLKIGVFLNNRMDLEDGKIKILYDLINSDFTDLKVIVNYQNNNKKIKNQLYKIITFFEKKYLLVTRKKELNFLTKKFKKIKAYTLKTDNQKEHYLNKKIINDFKKIDLFLLLENNLINNKIINLPKYGSWYLDFGVKDNVYSGFWDCYYNNDVSKVEIKKVKFINSKKKFFIIDKGFYSTKISSWFLNKDFIFEKSAILLKKNLKLLYFNKIKNKLSTQFSFRKNVPNFLNLLIYILKKYPKAFIRKIFQKIFYSNLNKKYNEPSHNPWNIHFGNKKKNINNLNLKDSLRIKPGKNEAWADPFLISIKNHDYIFFENFEFKSQKGKISCIKLKNNKILEKFDILKKNYHLSYPFIWREKKNFFMLPETSSNKSIQIWKCKKFPKNWYLYKKIFVGKSCVDTTILNKKNETWIFTNISDDKYEDHNSELYLFKTDKKFKKILSHNLNPVITDSRIARNAGNIFYQKKNRLIRPSQLNIFDFYGKGLNLRLIQKLSLKEFEEKNLKTFLPDFKSKINAVHHMSQNNTKYVIDVRYQKLLNRLFPR